MDCWKHGGFLRKMRIQNSRKSITWFFVNTIIEILGQFPWLKWPLIFVILTVNTHYYGISSQNFFFVKMTIFVRIFVLKIFSHRGPAFEPMRPREKKSACSISGEIENFRNEKSSNLNYKIRFQKFQKSMSWKFCKITCLFSSK